MRKFLTRRNIIVVIVIAAVVGIWWVRSNAAKQRAQAETRVVEVQRKDVTEALSVSGKVTADKIAILNFPVSGKLAFVRASEGKEVTAGAWLMGLDTGDLKSAETNAWYVYLAADANAKEIEDDVKGHDKDETFEQKNDRVAAQTARDRAWENLLVAQRAVNNSILKAPFAGVTTGITAKAVGDTVSVTDGVTVVDPKTLFFEIEIDESDLGRVSDGQEVIVTLDAFEEEKFSGLLSEIGFTARLSDTGATVFPAKVKFSEEVLGRLRLGLNGDADIVMGRSERVLTLPLEAVVDGEVEKEGGEIVEVKTGLESETEVEITEGLSEGDRIVIR